MTRDEAIEQMGQGIKITHPLFSHDEWMTMKDGKIHLEDGVRCKPNNFWDYRTADIWNDGYSVWEPLSITTTPPDSGEN